MNWGMPADGVCVRAHKTTTPTTHTHTHIVHVDYSRLKPRHTHTQWSVCVCEMVGLHWSLLACRLKLCSVTLRLCWLYKQKNQRNSGK